LDNLDLSKAGKHAYAIVRYLLEKNVVKKTEFLKIVPSSGTVDRTLGKLIELGLVTDKKEVIGRRIVFIQLTPKGRAVAEQLKKADEVAARTETYELPPDFGKEFEGLSAMTHLNVLEDHIAVTEHNYDGTGKDRIVMVYVKLNGRGFMRLFCEIDEAYECRHTRYAWTLPSVQEMVQIQRDKGNVKE
jgi:DNA-binding PadR family transcriptional regulator